MEGIKSIRLEVPEDFHTRIKVAASRSKLKYINQYCIDAIDRAIKDAEKDGGS